jgi:hypothetical protein
MQIWGLQGSWRRCLVHVGIALASYVAPASADSPIITFTPLTPTTLTLPANSDAVVRYQLTNQSTLQRTFDVLPIAGVEVVGGGGNCANPFTLASHQSCTLELHLVGSQMSGNINGGPIACISGNPLQCYQPAAPDQLQVTLGPAQLATIDAHPTALTIAVGDVASVTIENAIDAPVAAQNLAVDVPPGSSIEVDAGTCTLALQPGSSCELLIGGAVAETATVLVIAGDNTTSTSVTVTLIDDRIFADAFDAGPSTIVESSASCQASTNVRIHKKSSSVRGVFGPRAGAIPFSVACESCNTDARAACSRFGRHRARDREPEVGAFGHEGP